MPTSIRFKHELTCKAEYEDNEIYITQRTITKNIIEHAKQDCCKSMVIVMEMELKGAINKLHEDFVNGLYALFECYSNYYKYAYPENAPPYSNEEGAEILLQKFFESADESIYIYLNSNKQDFTTKHIATRHNRVNYGASDTFTAEEHKLCEKFIKVATDNIFLHITPVTVDLKRSYIDGLNKKEAESRTEALIQNRNTSSITTATAEALEEEDNVEPEKLVSLIDDRTAIAIRKSDKNKSKKKKKTDTRHTNTSGEKTTTLPNTSTDNNNDSVKHQGTGFDHQENTHHGRAPYRMEHQKKAHFNLPPYPSSHPLQPPTPHHYSHPTIEMLQQQINSIQEMSQYGDYPTSHPNHLQPSLYTPHSPHQPQQFELPSIHHGYLEHQTPSSLPPQQQHHYPGPGRGRGRGRGIQFPRGRGRGGRGGSNRGGRGGRSYHY